MYCKVSLGNQEQETDFAKDSLNNGNVPLNTAPQVPTLVWNCSMQFQLRSLNEEVLTFVVLEHNPYSLDGEFTPQILTTIYIFSIEFLGKAELKLKDIYSESQNINGPMVKKLILHQVESGELTVKLDLHMFQQY